ncbi:MAG TPA: ABC transporter ATP-binding protein [Blastocatellia bacterium]|nr:ABC transporter ATP-binding protein [Blastocatellia bacterium]
MSIVVLDKVSKKYRLSRLGSKSIREEMARMMKNLLPSSRGLAGSDEFYALKEVNLAIERGETVGFIGANGSGKSTLLKLLARIIYPNEGKIMVGGSVASLIEVGAGFHPELTGRENIFLYGSIMGMKKAEVAKKFDRIVAFSEMEKFIDTPVKRYSSGMYVRLGFAVAAHINPAVLLVDEVLAVGDANFQSKCQQRIEELRRGGMTIAFVSHDMPAVERLCDRVAFISKGQLRAMGKPQDVISLYYNEVLFAKKSNTHLAQNTTGIAIESKTSLYGQDAEIVSVKFYNGDGQETDTIATGDKLTVRLHYRTYTQIDDPVFEMLFYSPDDRLYSHLTTAINGPEIGSLPDEGMVEFDCSEFGLSPGVYKIDGILSKRGSVAPYDLKPRQYILKVLPGKSVRGMFYMPQQWRLLPPNETIVRPSTEITFG